MNHVKPTQICNVIVKSFDEYVDDVTNAFRSSDMIVGLDGSVDGSMPYEVLAKYYDVKEVTSIHADGTEYNAIWIAYKD